MQVQTKTKEHQSKKKISDLVDLVLKGIGAAMGIAVTVLSILGEMESKTAMPMLGLGLACLSISQLKK